MNYLIVNFSIFCAKKDKKKMAKEIKKLGCWMDVAPPLVVYPPYKPSNSPRLETITEGLNEEHDDEDS